MKYDLSVLKESLIPIEKNLILEKKRLKAWQQKKKRHAMSFIKMGMPFLTIVQRLELTEKEQTKLKRLMMNKELPKEKCSFWHKDEEYFSEEELIRGYVPPKYSELQGWEKETFDKL
jgi:hypothetical protein